MRLLSEKDIRKVFSMEDAIEAVAKAFMLHVQDKCEVPLRTQIVNEKAGGTFLFMPAYIDELDAASIKIVNIFSGNAKKQLPTAPAEVLLMDGSTGLFNAMIDGTYLTQLRTGAASGIALKTLARKDAKVGLLIGTGSQAQCQLEAMISVRDLDRVYVSSIDFDQTKAFCDNVSTIINLKNTKLIPVENNDDVINEADVIICCTSSTKPVFDATKVKTGVTISCVGSFQHHMQELDPKIFERSTKLYFDSQEAVLSEAGDILIPLEAGLISEKDFTGDLGDVLLAKLVGRENDDEIIVFKTVGLGSQDLVTAYEIYNAAKNKEVGLEWNSSEE